MEVTITAFAESRGVDRIAVNQWIRRHEEVLKDCRMEGKDRVIDSESEGYALLDQQYPNPRPTVIADHNPDDLREMDELSRENKAYLIKIAAIQEKLLALQNEIQEKNQMLASADREHFLLELRSEELETARERLQKTEDSLEMTREELKRSEEARESAEKNGIRLESENKLLEDEIDRKTAEMEFQRAESEAQKEEIEEMKKERERFEELNWFQKMRFKFERK